MAWVLYWQSNRDEPVVPLWSGFNALLTNATQEETMIGCLPIINAPAHDYDTLWTVIERSRRMTRQLGQKYSVMTFDEQLYCKAKMLQWRRWDDCQDLVILLGGFHIQLNFSKVIGQHMANCGLEDIWVESGVFGRNTAENIMKGKMWNRVFRAHKLTLAALWTVLWPKIVTWMEDNNHADETDVLDHLIVQLAASLKARDKANVSEYFSVLSSQCEKLCETIREFDNSNSDDPTLMLWRTYMQLVSILLAFTRAIRIGDWHLYLSSFAEILPWFARYDHAHYTRWGAVFLADMHQLEKNAPEVHRGFLNGDFVVKESANHFNQVPDDQALEHYNKLGKIAGGLIGITQKEPAMNRWSITYNERSKLAEDTHKLLGWKRLDEDGEFSHKECGVSRMKRDQQDVCNLIEQFERFQIFEMSDFCFGELVHLTNGDVAPTDIRCDLISALEKGKEGLTKFTDETLIQKRVVFHDPLLKQKAKTMNSLYDADVSKDKKKSPVTSHRDMFRRLLIAKDAGRDVNIDSLLERELSEKPLSLTTADGRLRKANKSQLIEIIAHGVIQKGLPATPYLKTCTIIDGMALVQALGKPSGLQTFGQLADLFIDIVKSNGNLSNRIDVLFDRYEERSIKEGTRVIRSGGVKTVRRIISNRDVKLPDNWKSFIGLDANKANLASFLSEELLKDGCFDGKQVIC